MLHLLLLAKHKLTVPEQLHTNRSAGSLPYTVPNDGADERTCRTGGRAHQDHSASRAGGRGEIFPMRMNRAPTGWGHLQSSLPTSTVPRFCNPFPHLTDFEPGLYFILAEDTLSPTLRSLILERVQQKQRAHCCKGASVPPQYRSGRTQKLIMATGSYFKC